MDCRSRKSRSLNQSINRSTDQWSDSKAPNVSSITINLLLLRAIFTYISATAAVSSVAAASARPETALGVLLIAAVLLDLTSLVVITALLMVTTLVLQICKNMASFEAIWAKNITDEKKKILRNKNLPRPGSRLDNRDSGSPVRRRESHHGRGRDHGCWRTDCPGRARRPARSRWPPRDPKTWQKPKNVMEISRISVESTPLTGYVYRLYSRTAVKRLGNHINWWGHFFQSAYLFALDNVKFHVLAISDAAKVLFRVIAHDRGLCREKCRWRFWAQFKCNLLRWWDDHHRIRMQPVFGKSTIPDEWKYPPSYRRCKKRRLDKHVTNITSSCHGRHAWKWEEESFLAEFPTPSSTHRLMKPYPLFTLNHFTIPLTFVAAKRRIKKAI